MDRPTKLEVGQKWQYYTGEVFRIKLVCADGSTKLVWLQDTGTEVEQVGYWPIDEDYNFVGWYKDHGPKQDPVANTTGQQAADWLRKVADVLVEKGKSYGDSIGNPLRIFSHVGVTEGVRVRIDDKLSRVARGKEWPGDDVIVDLVGYLALLAVTEEHK